MKILSNILRQACDSFLIIITATAIIMWTLCLQSKYAHEQKYKVSVVNNDVTKSVEYAER